MKLADKQSALRDAQTAEKSTRLLYQESQLAQKRLRTLLKFLPDSVFVFTLDNTVEYINPAFERIFGWTFKEIKGKNIRFIPDHLNDQAKQGMKQLFENQVVHDFETQRYTKDGRILDILINGSIFYDEDNKPAGQILILRDMTIEKRMAKSNKIMFKISNALHQYQELGGLIALINQEIQKLISVEGAFILQRVDDETDLVTENILSVPIKLKDRTIGVVSVVNKNHGEFDNTDIELLSMVTNTIALPIENTRIHEELRKSYEELKTLNHAKDKVINHLAHELKTPIAVLKASMTLLLKKFKALGVENHLIESVLARGQRNLNRILDVQYEVEDLLRKKFFSLPVHNNLIYYQDFILCEY